MTLQEVVRKYGRVDAVDAEGTQPARASGGEIREDANAGMAAETLRPSPLQIVKARRLALGAEPLMEDQSVGHPHVWRERLSAHPLKLPDVITDLLPSRCERPQFTDQFTPNVEKTGTEGCHQPFLTACPVVVALERA